MRGLETEALDTSGEVLLTGRLECRREKRKALRRAGERTKEAGADTDRTRQSPRAHRPGPSSCTVNYRTRFCIFNIIGEVVSFGISTHKQNNTCSL